MKQLSMNPGSILFVSDRFFIFLNNGDGKVKITYLGYTINLTFTLN